ncbi:YbxH family protein [Heyndrickxia sporothermodurans]
MGAIERNGFLFEPEFSVISQNGAIHVYKDGRFIEEIKFEFNGEYPEHNQIEELVNYYCKKLDEHQGGKQ